jgi:hypothetical protein
MEIIKPYIHIYVYVYINAYTLGVVEVVKLGAHVLVRLPIWRQTKLLYAGILNTFDVVSARLRLRPLGLDDKNLFRHASADIYRYVCI